MTPYSTRPRRGDQVHVKLSRTSSMTRFSKLDLLIESFTPCPDRKTRARLNRISSQGEVCVTSIVVRSGSALFIARA
jgi:hypothetical protein